MAHGFTKLFSSITESTVWCESHATRIVWITMLAMADRKGRVEASVPGLANRARVTLEECEHALARFTEPDRYSRTPDNDGRRIEKIDGGWRLLNYAKYREMRDHEARIEQQRLWDRTHRSKSSRNPTRSDISDQTRPRPTKAEAEAEAEESLPSPDGEGATGVAGSPAPRALVKVPKVPDCPHELLIALYHEILPACPRMREWNETRRGYLRARWREKAKPNGTTQGYATVEEGLAWWRKFFEWVAESRFLTGRTEGRDDKSPFVADLEWLITPKWFARIVEGKYHRDAA